AAWAARGLHKLVSAQLAEQLLQVGKRNTLALADRGEGHGAVALAQGQINHRGDRKTALGGKTHRKLLVARGKKPPAHCWRADNLAHTPCWLGATAGSRKDPLF